MAQAVAETVRRRRRNRRQRRGLRLAPEGRGARRARRRRLRAAGGGAEGRAASARRCASPSRTRATWPTRRGSASSRATLLDSIPGPRARRAGRAGDLLRLGRDLQPHAAGRGARARRPQGAARPRDRAGRLREREPRLPRAGLGRAAPRGPRRCPRCTRSSSSTRRSAASPPASCWLLPGASEIDAARLAEPLELVLAAIRELEAGPGDEVAHRRGDERLAALRDA